MSLMGEATFNVESIHCFHVFWLHVHSLDINPLVKVVMSVKGVDSTHYEVIHVVVE